MSVAKYAKAGSKRRIGRGVAVQTLLVVVIVFAANYLSFHYYDRWDFSRSQDFRLAMQTRQILRQLAAPLEITVYFSPTQFGLESLISRDVDSLLKEIQFSGKPRVRVERVDPTRDLRRAKEIQSRLGFGPGESVLVFEYDGRSKTVPIAGLADFDLTQLAGGGEPRVSAFRGEQVFASTILGLLDPKPRTIYFLQGYGGPAAGGALSVLADSLRRLNATVAPLSLAGAGAIPEDASLIVIAGAEYDIPERERDILLEWWKRDGRFLVLLDPDSNTPRLRELVEAAGIYPRNNRVLRTLRLPFAIGILREVNGVFTRDNEITKRFAGVFTHFPEPVQSLEPAPPEGSGIQVRPLIEADEPFWGETEFLTDEDKGVAYDDTVDDGYPVYLALAADRGGIADDRVAIQSAKMVVTGASRFAEDEFIGGGDGRVANLDFLSSAANWLMDRNPVTGIAPKSIREFRLALTDEQLARISLFTMVVIPGFAALLGVMVWLRRRK